MSEQLEEPVRGWEAEGCSTREGVVRFYECKLSDAVRWRSCALARYATYAYVAGNISQTNRGAQAADMARVARLVGHTSGDKPIFVDVTELPSADESMMGWVAGMRKPVVAVSVCL